MKKIILMASLLIILNIAFQQHSIANNENPTKVITAIKGYTLDNIIESKLNMIYSLNPALSKYNLSVSSADGVVEIEGAVSNNYEKDLATDLAKMVGHVNNVTNKLVVDKSVKTGEEYSTWLQKIFDTTITASVKSNLLLDPRTNALKIKVITINNIVTLTGMANSTMERRVAGEIAAKTDDVRAVKNLLAVEKNQPSQTKD